MVRTIYFKWFYIGILLFLLSIPSISQAQLWQQTTGPGGDGITSIAVNAKGDIFTTSRGLNRSTDGGATWVRLPTGTVNWELSKVIIGRSGRIIACHNNKPGDRSTNNLFVSDDNGDHWKQLPEKIYELWQGGNSDLFSLYYDEISFLPRALLSSDQGETWDTIKAEGLIGSIMGFSSTPSGLLLAVTQQYMYKSDDHGITWSKVVNGLKIRNLCCSPTLGPVVKVVILHN